MSIPDDSTATFTKYIARLNESLAQLATVKPMSLSEIWAFRCIRAAALARWLRAVGIVMSRAPFLADIDGMGDFTDIIDIILAQLASWHAALPHDEALPRRQPWL